MDQAPQVPINYLAVLIAGLIPMAVGAFWYSPAMFAKKWLALIGKTEEEIKKSSPAKAYAISFLTSLIMSFILAHGVVFGSSYMHVSGFGAGLQTGFWVWLGYVVTTNASTVLFEFRPAGLYWINMGYNFICLLLMGGLLAAWA